MKFVKKLGIAQIPVLIGLLIMMVALPVASNLVKEEQDVRDKAASYFFICSDDNGSGSYRTLYYSSQEDCRKDYPGQCWLSELDAKKYCGYKNCNRCSSNNGCERVYYRVTDGNCDTTNINAVLVQQRVVDCNCPKRYGAGGGNDETCYQDCVGSSPTKWYFCLREDDDNGHVYVSAVDSGKDNESDCENVARSYGGDAYPGTQYDRGDVTGLCVQDPSSCNEELLHQFYKCSGSACVESDLHFDKDSCTRALRFWANENNEIIGSHSICFSNNTCKDGDIQCPSDKPKVSCYFNGKTYNEGEVFCTNCLNGTGNSCVGKCKAKSDGTDGGVIDFDYESCSNKGLICQVGSGSCVKNDRIYLHYCDSKGNVTITDGTYTNDASGIAECEKFYGTKCERDGNDLNCKKPVGWYYCDGTQSTCKVDTNSYVDSASCSRAHGGRWCYYSDEKNYCDNLCSQADYRYYCGNNGCERTTQKFATDSDCTAVLGKVCYQTSSDCEKKCNSVPIDTSCTDYEGNKIGNNLKGCSKPDLISTCRNAQWSNASGDFASCKSDERCSDGVCLKVYCYGNDGKPTTINTTGCVTESSLATCQIDSTTRSARWVGQQACNYGCENGQCKEKPIVDPCDSKNCSWGCVNGKCKCNLNGTNYLSGERACNTGNTAVNECNDGNWNYNVDVCSSNEVCKDGKCVINSNDPCTGKTCIYGCENGKCKCYLDNKYYFDGQTVCSKTNTGYIDRCSDGSWTKNVQLCKSSEVCENGQCRAKTSKNCTGYQGEVQSGSWGCTTPIQRGSCLNGAWVETKNCGVDEKCVNGQCQKIYCYGVQTVSPGTRACETTFSSSLCKRNSVTGVAEWADQIDCGIYGCKNGVCNSPPQLNQCTDHYGIKVNANNKGCSNVFQISKCQDDGKWSIKSSDITNCGVDERCWNGKCEKIYCTSAYDTVSPNDRGCWTSSALGLCRRDPKTGDAMWGSKDECESGECRNGGCVNEEKKCTQCTTSVGNRTRGDADCDGKVTLNDWALWFKEFESGNKGTEQKKTWFADFTCDGKVNNDDLDIWFTNYLIDQRK